MGKSIKKIYKILIIILVVIITLPVTAYFVLQNNNVQTYLTQKIAKTISENMNAKFQVEAVNYRFFNKIVLQNVYIEDQAEDSLLFAKEIIGKLKKVDRKNRIVDINSINLINAKFYLNKTDSLEPVNLKFIVDQIKRDSANTKPRWEIILNNIEMHQSVFRFRNYKELSKDYGVEFSNLVCYIDNLDIRNLTVKNKVVDFYIKNLKFTEQSGFQVYNLKSNMSIGKQHMVFENIRIRTPNSFIHSDSLSFRHKDFDDYSEFVSLVKLDYAFLESNVSFRDIGYFAPNLKDIDMNLVVSGRVHGRINSLKGKDVKFQVGKQTELITDFDFNGLPDINNTFIYANFKKLTASAKDLEVINKFNNGKNKLTIPENLEKLGIISYQGNFTGFIDDFVTYGKFTTDLGNISTDLSLKPDTSKTLAFDGKLETTNFKIGELVDNSERVGKITMNAQIEGSIGRDKTLKANTDGIIQNIEINNYNYQNIIIDGYLTEKTYDGLLNISDPNIEFDFSGNIDFSAEIPVFNFQANVPKANLYGLNIDRKDTTAFLSFKVDANFTGINIDHAIGEINFSEAELIKFNEKMDFDTLKIISEQTPDTHRITLKSDYIDALLYGNYKSSTLVQSMKNLFFKYIPALITQPTDTLKIDFDNHFVLDLALKNTSKVTRFFIPSLTISDSANIELNYNAINQHFHLNGSAEKVNFNTHTFNNLAINLMSTDSLFTASTRTKSVLLNDYIFLENFKTTSITGNNNINLKIDWNNSDKDPTDYKGKILASTHINQKKAYDDPSFNITILPSQVMVNDSLWNINKSILKIDSTAFTINNFSINHDNQFFKIDGRISENPEDSLLMAFSNLNLSHLNMITQGKNLDFDGVINGNASFSNIYKNPLFFSKIIIDDLTLNKEKLGYTQIFSTWVEEKKAIKIDAFTQTEGLKSFNISGEYFPGDKTIDFGVTLNQLNLNILNPFLSSFAYNISGASTGDVAINGTLNKPIFNGSLYLEKSEMTIDYIKTKYFFNTHTKIENNSIIFNNVNVLDNYGNFATTNGFVKFGPQKNISFNFDINADKILALNTTGLDNDMFYGTAFMSGFINIAGSTGNVFIDISGRTERNTKINIPLQRTGTADKSGFITFINNKTEEEFIDDYHIDLSGFGLNFDLEVTPEAEALLIFDSKIGDVIRARGEGNIKMEIDANNNFNMFGDYTIEEGDYLFTLQNVINKKFEIERGGTILWSGAPYNANIDVEAIYKLRTQLTNLFPEDSTEYYRRRIPVECQIYLTDNLMNPNILFDINLPSADEEINTRVKSAINTQEKLNRQFLSLLVLNSFMPEQQQGTSNYFADGGTAGLGSVTTSELLSNQLSHWLSQISEEWDLGVNYRPGDDISKDQVEVALSTQLLNDRVSINGNLGYGGQTTERATNLVGDFNVDVKLTKSGKLRLKAFNESNDRLLYEYAPYTQGVGIFYREEFNSFSELLKRFWNNFSRKKKDDDN